MESSNEKGRFPKSLGKNLASVLLGVKGTLGGRDIIISIAPIECNNYVTPEFANQLVIPKSNISEKIGLWNKKQYDISNLQLNIGDYTFVSPFIVGSLWSDDGDILMSSPWIETLRSFILNTRNKFLTFSYKKKKIMLQDIKLDSNLVTSEDLKDISNIILQDNQKIVQKMQKYFDKVVAVKGEEIYRLKNHS